MSSVVTTYEQRLRADFDRALREGSMHFEEESAVQKSLRRIARRLDEIGVPYASRAGLRCSSTATAGSPKTWTSW